MNTQAFIYCVITALCFGGWPLVARFTNLTPKWIAITSTLGTTAVVALVSLKGLAVPQIKDVIIGIAGGALNGVGVVLYGSLIATKEWNVSQTIPLSMVIAPFVVALGGYFIFNETFTLNKILGVLFGIIAIWFLSH